MYINTHVSTTISNKNTANSNFKETEHNMENHFPLKNLPSHIILDILIKLPVISIILCKCVCKAWYNLISTPEFIPLHFSQSRPGLLVHHSEMFKNYVKLVDFGHHSDHRDLTYNQRLKFDLKKLSAYTDADIVVDGSVNGFLFLRDVNYKHETMYVCNPATRQYVILPKPKGVIRYPGALTHGFGVGPTTGQYKVVRIFHERILDPITNACLGITSSECQVYTLGTGSWRDIGRVRFAYNSDLIGLFFNGNLHWLIEDLDGYMGEERQLISFFDLENEVFRPFPPPFPGRKLFGTLGVLGGTLCLCDNTSEWDIHIWVMKEYGVKKSWLKQIVVKKTPELVGPSFRVVHVLKVYRDGVVLLLWGNYFMFFYDTKSDTTFTVDMDQTRGPNNIEAIHHVSSFLPLRSLKKEDVYFL